jgi:prevent-host-death family protein
MQMASVSYSKNNLSALLEKVKRGESVIITDRGRAVARLEPIDNGMPAQMEDLVRRGIVSPPKRTLDVRNFLKLPRPRLRGQNSLVAAVLEEREQER